MNPRFVNSSMAGFPAMDLVLGEKIKGRIFLRNTAKSPQKNILDLFLSQGCEIISPIQVHKTAILRDGPVLPERAEGDGILLTDRDALGSIQTADCFPVLISGESGAPWKMVLHSGFKGTVENIVNSGFEKVRAECSLELKKSFAWIGPGIGPCCYCRELNDPWTEKAMDSLGEGSFRRDGGKIFFDLCSAILKQLMEIGIPPENIAVRDDCTSCNDQSFFSYRKGDKEKRMVLITGNDDAIFASSRG